MPILVRIMIFSLIALPVIDASGEELRIPVSPDFPADDGPFELVPTHELGSTRPVERTSQRELVSILKRKLPQTNEPIELSDAPEWFQNLMQRIVRESVPTKYVQDKDWGKTDKRWDGLKIQRKGLLRVTTKRRWKDVNHGTWKRYEITQIGPNENLTMRIDNVHDAGKGKVGFDVNLAAKLHVHGRTAKWTKGVQLYSVSADANARVNMQLACEVGMKLDLLRFPPDVVLAPVVTRADLDVADFRLQSVSKLDGPVVKQLSNSVHRVLLDKIEEKRDQLPKKINRQIAKNEDKMRLSLADFASKKWSVLTRADSTVEHDLDQASPSNEGGHLEAITQQPVVPDRATSSADAELIDLVSPREVAELPQKNSNGPVLVGPAN